MHQQMMMKSMSSDAKRLIPSVDFFAEHRYIAQFCIGKTVLYVGKALSLSARHDPDRHHVYSLIKRIEETRKALLQLKWIDFSPLPYDRAELDVILLGFEEHLIELFKPQWNLRLNGVSLSKAKIDHVYSQLKLIKQTAMNNTTGINTTETNALLNADKINEVARRKATERKGTETFNKQDWNLCEQARIKDLVFEMNSYRARPLSPSEMIEISLLCLASKLQECRIPLKQAEPNISSFAPEFVKNPQLFQVAQANMQAIPGLSLNELVLRCMAKDVNAISPVDYGILFAIHSAAKLNENEQNAILPALQGEAAETKADATLEAINAN